MRSIIAPSRSGARLRQTGRAAALITSVGLLLAGWGAFIWFNRAAEDVEPEAMAEAKREDKKLK